MSRHVIYDSQTRHECINVKHGVCYFINVRTVILLLIYIRYTLHRCFFLLVCSLKGICWKIKKCPFHANPFNYLLCRYIFMLLLTVIVAFWLIATLSKVHFTSDFLDVTMKLMEFSSARFLLQNVEDVLSKEERIRGIIFHQKRDKNITM